MSSKPLPALFVAFGFLLSACASSSPEPTGTAEPPGPGGADVAATEGAAPTESGLARIYSESQAERGSEVFRSVCSECHYRTEFHDDQFTSSWRRRSLADLFGHIQDTMPENAPGSLSSGQYADVVAYILSLNGVPAGTVDLPTDRGPLDAYDLSSLSGS
jgi:mono/diheme cytochrome c family protein